MVDRQALRKLAQRAMRAALAVLGPDRNAVLIVIDRSRPLGSITAEPPMVIASYDMTKWESQALFLELSLSVSGDGERID